MGITRVGIAEYLRDRQTQREMLLRAEGNACKVGQQRVLNLLHNMYLVGIFVHSPRGAFTRFHTARNEISVPAGEECSAGPHR